MPASRVSKLSERFRLVILIAGALVIVSFLVGPGIVRLFQQRVIHSWYAQQAEAQRGVTLELAANAQDAQDIAQEPNIRNYLNAHENIQLLAVLQDEQQQRGADGIVAIDEDGVVVTRTASPLSRGDFIFNSSAGGRLLAKGQGYSAVTRAMLFPASLTSGEPIIVEGKVAGAIAVLRYLDDEYVSRFKETYIEPGSEIAFYSIEQGIAGTTISDTDVLDILKENVSPGSGLATAASQHIVSIDNKTYLLEVLPLAGIEDFQAGVLVLTPINVWLLAAVIALLLGLVLIGVMILFLGLEFLRLHWILFANIALIYFALITIGTKEFFDSNVLPLTDVEVPIYNSVLYVDPETGFFSTEFSRRIGIRVVPGGEPINAVEATLEYDSNLIEVIDIITVNSICGQEFFLEKNIDNAQGRVSISCLVPSPGYIKTNGIVAELLIQPKRVGRASFRFTKDSQVLAHDGLGTNVLRLATPASYFVIGTESLDERVHPLIIFSSTHPNPERWYNKSLADVSWRAVEGNVYRYGIDSNPTDEATVFSEPAFINKVSEKVIGEGMYYFHLQELKNNTVIRRRTFRLMVDVAPPLATIRASQTQASVGETIRFEFSGKDTESGLQPLFYVKIDNGIFLPTNPTLQVAFPDAGTHHVTLRVFDNAGNMRDETLAISVSHTSFAQPILNAASILFSTDFLNNE